MTEEVRQRMSRNEEEGLRTLKNGKMLIPTRLRDEWAAGIRQVKWTIFTNETWSENLSSIEREV